MLPETGATLYLKINTAANAETEKIGNQRELLWRKAGMKENMKFLQQANLGYFTFSKFMFFFASCYINISLTEAQRSKLL